MTPKEKAENLINKYLKLCVEKDYHQDFKLIQAKRGALIAVDEVIDVIDRDMNYQNVYSFYLSVKQEIEKL